MRHNILGLALIEVLIALAILSIALTAIIRATSQNIRDTAYLEDKTIAHWVGLEAINQANLNLIALSDDEPIENNVIMLGRAWNWQAYLQPTPNEHIKEIHVDVYRCDDHLKIATLMSYHYVL